MDQGAIAFPLARQPPLQAIAACNKLPTEHEGRMTTLKLRLVFDAAMLGPGKAALLAAIGDSGSIAAAGRQMGMSYKRAWSLVEEMNAAFVAPVVASTRGGAGGGRAGLTATGAQVLALYLTVLAKAETAAAAEIAALRALLREQGDTDPAPQK